MKVFVRHNWFERLGGRRLRRGDASRANGFTLIELIMTLTVLTVMTLGVIPLVKVSVKRQREQRLREELRQMRNAIDQFHREAIAGAMLQRSRAGGQPAGGGGGGGDGSGGAGGGIYIDPRVRVGITDQLVFSSDNPDLYPPSLETLVSGVSVTPIPGAGPVGVDNRSVFDQKATDNTLTSTKKKVYLRSIPIDPMTGESDWDLRSTYDTPDSSSWGGENVFDVRSKSTETALDGTKYNEW
ncbi:MAG TPA: type II secretion system protein [Pyrinomonadaceae bacterium]|nr:type II secretion system protein [Pyrinomonadaceae bacterium]